MLNSRLKQDSQRGIALVIVMWLLVLLTVMAAGYTATMRTETRLTARQLFAAQSRALAEAGIWLAVNDLLKPETQRKWAADGSANKMDLYNGSVELRIQDESGLIDLNTARSELLQGLFKSTGLDDDAAARLTDAVLDWRDRDNLTRVNGAEDSDYRQAGYPYGAKNGPFNSIDELRKVMGMTEEIYNKVHPALTVYSHMPGVNPEVATREVLLAIPGIAPDTVAQFLDERSQTAATPVSPVTPGINSTFTNRSKGVSFMITSTGKVNDTSVTLAAVFSLRRTSNRPYTILSWREE